MKTIQMIGIIIFSIWFFGAGMMLGVYEVERKNECIDKEGLLKGLFWCKTDPISNSEITAHIIASFIKGLAWPNQFFSRNISDSNMPEEIRDYYYSTPREFRIPEEFIGKSYEYIRATGYGDNWISAESNFFKLRLPQTGQFGFKQYFKLNSGECEKYLTELKADRIFQMLISANYSIRSEFEGKDDIPLKHAKLQCMTSAVIDQKCEEKINKIAPELITVFERIDPVDGKATAFFFLLEKIKDCEVINEVGQKRIFSLEDSKN